MSKKLISKNSIVGIIIVVVVLILLIVGIQYDKNEKTRIKQEILNTPVPTITILSDT
jgi:hypothetical protein